MRATSRLVLVWTSISLVAVAVGWAALDSAIGTGNPEPAEVAALDPSVLAPAPPAPSESGSPSALPDVKASPSKAARAVSPAGRRPKQRSTPDPTKSPIPSTSPTPSASPLPPEGDYPNSEPNRNAPSGVVREIDTDGGSATVRFADFSVHLLDYTVEPGYTVSGTREAEDYIIVRFLSPNHSSTIHAYVDDDGSYRVKVIEERS